MGNSCLSLFEDFNKDNEFDLTEEERKEEIMRNRKKCTVMRRGSKGYEVK